ncbi:hypothetical protein RUM44_010039 [Polyplax serrata]|uniref:Inositol-1-monophosphatase n=1 Tax=Polyplax serrata TaxID=468196 RepID=A0ABR1AV28_POLSC
MTDNLDRCYDVVVSCVKHVGEIIKERIWQTKAKVDAKSCDIDLVTETDQEVEKFLITNLKNNFPDHMFIGEENVSEGGKCDLTDKPTWIIDPVDGTMNFVHGYPNVCISVALLVNKVPEIAIIYNPVINYMFEARRGLGAKLNGQRIQVSKETELSKSLVAFEFGTSRDPEKQKNVLENITSLIGKVHGVRSAGSAAMNMAFVALGSCDVYFEFGTHAWDVAAGDLLVREAGGVVIDPAGGDFDVLSRRVLAASTRSVADKLIKELSQHYPERD